MSAILTRPEAAAYLDLTVAWLARHARDGIGPPMIRLGGLVRYRRQDLDDWILNLPTEEESSECPAPKQERTDSSAGRSGGRTAASTRPRRGGAGSPSEAADGSAARARRTADALRSRLGDSKPKPRPGLQLVPEQAG